MPRKTPTAKKKRLPPPPPPICCRRHSLCRYDCEGANLPVALHRGSRSRRREKGRGTREGTRWGRLSERSSCLPPVKLACLETPGAASNQPQRCVASRRSVVTCRIDLAWPLLCACALRSVLVSVFFCFFLSCLCAHPGIRCPRGFGGRVAWFSLFLRIFPPLPVPPIVCDV